MGWDSRVQCVCVLCVCALTPCANSQICARPNCIYSSVCAPPLPNLCPCAPPLHSYTSLPTPPPLCTLPLPTPTLYPASPPPLCAASLSSLRELDVSRCQVTFLPPAVFELQQLQTLNASFNLLSTLPGDSSAVSST